MPSCIISHDTLVPYFNYYNCCYYCYCVITVTASACVITVIASVVWARARASRGHWGERRVCGCQSRVGGYGTRAGRRQSIAMGGQSIKSEVAAAVILTTLTVIHNRCLVEAPGKGWALDVRGIR